MTTSQHQHPTAPANTACIYEIRCGGKQYFGATKNYAGRIAQHRRALSQGKHHNPHLQRAWNAGGTFESWVREVADLEDLGLFEQLYLEEYPGSVNIERVSSLLPGVRKEIIRRGWPEPGSIAVKQAVLTPRPNQREAEQAVLDALARGETAGLVRSPCGTGKTKLAALLGNHFGRCLFITHNETLIEGTIEALHATWVGHHVGVLKQAEHFIAEKWTVASLPTLIRRLPEIPPETFDLIVCDEAHLFGANMGVSVMQHFRPRYFAGLTATPERYSGTPLSQLFGEKMVYDLSVRRAIDLGLIVSMDALNVQFKLREAKLNITGDDYDQSDVANIMSSRQILQRSAELIHEHAVGQTLVYASTRKHARQLTEALGPGAECATGAEKGAHARIQAFRRGEFPILVSCRMIGLGFDCPEVETIVLATMTKSPVTFTQNVGRGMRTAPGKEKALLIDLGGNLERGMRIDPEWHFGIRELDPLRESSGGSVTALGDDLPWEWPEGNEITVDIAATDLMQPPARTEYRVSELSLATERQLATLRRLGYIPAPGLNRRQAYELIRHHPVTQLQRQGLAERGYDIQAEWGYMLAQQVLSGA